MKTHKPLFVVSDYGDEGEWLAMRDDYPVSRLATDDDIGLESLADMLDQDAENANMHDFVGCHRKLGGIILRRTNRSIATEVLRDLADVGGLQGLAESEDA